MLTAPLRRTPGGVRPAQPAACACQAVAAVLRWALIVAGIAVFALVASQFLLPGLIERDVEDRLTEGGGSAEVSVGSIPALRLLWSDGERFEVDARELDLDLDEDRDVFSSLDGFGTVEIAIDEFRAGPFELERFALTRDAPAPYSLSAVGDTSPGALAEAAPSLGLPGGPLAGLALETLFGADDARIPIELEMQLTSEDGQVDSEGDATVAGIPAGPLAEVITSAIVSRL